MTFQSTTPTIPIDCSICEIEPCLCHELRASARSRAEAQLASGLELGSMGDFAGALSSLEKVIQSGVSNRDVYEAAGLCALALGEADKARRWWLAAVKRDEGSRAAEWLRSLNSGQIHDALLQFNNALKAAQAGEFAGATASLDELLQVLPDLQPAIHLRNVISQVDYSIAVPSASGKRSARTAWISIGLTSVMASFLIGVSVTRKTLTMVSNEPGLPASLIDSSGSNALPTKPAHAPQIESALNAALRDVVMGRSGALVELVALTGPDTSLWPKAARDRISNLHLDAARRSFFRATHALSGSDGMAVADLKRAVAFGSRTYLEDDAIYELARAEARLGLTADANATANHLLHKYPNSIFANSTMRKLAGINSDTRN